MKKKLSLQKKNLFFKSFYPKRIKFRLTKKFWFFKKYFYVGAFLKNFFLKNKKYYFYHFNFFQYIFFCNWTKYFSSKYYSIYFEDLNIFLLKFIPTLQKFSSHYGDMQKFYFVDKQLWYYLPMYKFFISLSKLVNQFFLLIYSYTFIYCFYKLVVMLIFFSKFCK